MFFLRWFFLCRLECNKRRLCSPIALCVCDTQKAISIDTFPRTSSPKRMYSGMCVCVCACACVTNRGKHMEIEAQIISSKYLRNSMQNRPRTMDLPNGIYNLTFKRWILRLSIRFAGEMYSHLIYFSARPVFISVAPFTSFTMQARELWWALHWLSTSGVIDQCKLRRKKIVHICNRNQWQTFNLFAYTSTICSGILIWFHSNGRYLQF